LRCGNATPCERLPVVIENRPSLSSCQATKPPLTWARAVMRGGVSTSALA